MEKTKEYKSTQKFLLMSPRKIRLVAALIKKMKPAEAIEKLPFVQKRSAAEVAKVIKAAMANARNQGASDADLIFKEIQVTEGPRLKRGIAVSRGRWHAIKKRMSHIRVVLTEVKGKRQGVKAEEIKEDKKEVKAKVVKKETKKEEKK